MPVPAGYTAVTGTKLTDATGAPLSNATIFFQPCNNQGTPISFCVNGAGQATDLPVPAQVTGGAFTVQLADTKLAQPANVGYLVTVVDNLSQKQMLGPGYIIQPYGAAWSFDSFIPALGSLAIIQKGPAGAQGPEGPVGPPNAGLGTNNFAEVPIGAFDGVNATFTTTHTPVMRWLYRSGLFMKPGPLSDPTADYTPSGASFTYRTPPDPATESGHFIQYIY